MVPCAPPALPAPPAPTRGGREREGVRFRISGPNLGCAQIWGVWGRITHLFGALLLSAPHVIELILHAIQRVLVQTQRRRSVPDMA